MHTNRRRLLRGLGILSLGGLAGCVGDGNSTPAESSTQPDSDQPTVTGGTFRSDPSRVAELTSDGAGGIISSEVAVSRDGTTALVGAFSEENDQRPRIQVFSDENSWERRTVLTPRDEEEIEYFGSSIAVSSDGQTALVGAWDPTREDVGSAYVFTQGDTWTQQAKLSPDTDAETGAIFGYAVALSDDGETIAVGSGGENTVYVFSKDDSAWTSATTLAPPGHLVGHNGVAVSSDGTTILVVTGGDSGASAYLFSGSSGSWTREAKLAPDDIDENDGFGHSVALSADGTTALVGAPGTADPDIETEDVPDFGEQLSLTHSGEVRDLRGNDEVTIRIQLEVSPRMVWIDPGTTVTFEWESRSHNVVRQEGPAGLDSGDPTSETGAGYEYTFEETGITIYACEPHIWAGAVGGIAVGDNVEMTTVPVEDADSAGVAYMFTFTGRDGGWSGASTLVPDDGSPDDTFGRTVALGEGGSTALIGAPGDDVPPNRGKQIPDFGDYLNEATNDEIRDLRGKDEVTVQVGTGNAFGFAPGGILIDSGTTVKWDWTGSGGPHNVVATEDASATFDSGDPVEGTGVKFQHTFETSGIHNYYCAPHRTVGMVGAVAVGEGVPTVIANTEDGGSAYVFSDGDGTWARESKFRPDDVRHQYAFAASVGLTGDAGTSIVSAPGVRGPDGERQGSAYVFDL